MKKTVFALKYCMNKTGFSTTSEGNMEEEKQKLTTCVKSYESAMNLFKSE